VPYLTISTLLTTTFSSSGFDTNQLYHPAIQQKDADGKVRYYLMKADTGEFGPFVGTITQSEQSGGFVRCHIEFSGDPSASSNEMTVEIKKIDIA